MPTREAQLESLQQTYFDVLIIGGGINGAACAARLAARGLTVCVCDMEDFGCGTSQESSNLIWGGIKYLENRERSLVEDLCLARNSLCKRFPHLISEIRYLFTRDLDCRLSPFRLKFAVWYYWFLGRCFGQRPRTLRVKDIVMEESVIQTKSCTGGIEYSDAYLLEHDARFVFSFIRSAVKHGAQCMNYVQAHDAAQNRDGAWLTNVTDLLEQRSFQVRSKIIINATGPSVDLINKQSAIETDHHLVWSRGVHLVTRQITPNHRVLCFFADDGRLFYAIPMSGKTCIGTTDTRVEKLPALVSEKDRTFILENINKRLDLKEPLTEDDIISERCGVRPLVVLGEVQNESWHTSSRRHVVEADKRQKYMSIFGGKLTDCLNVASEVEDIVASLGVPLGKLQRDWCGEPPMKEYKSFVKAALELEIVNPDRLWRRYGNDASYLLKMIAEDPHLGEEMLPGGEVLWCEVYFMAKHEMIIHLEDFLRRRTLLACIYTRKELQESPGVRKACDILFGEDAQKEYDLYFSS